MNKIAIYLNRHITGNVFDKDNILDAYSTDNSALKVKPRFVALPESTSDIRKLVKFVNQLAEKKYELPIAVRGSGLSKTGADLTDGLVLSMERMNHVRELDVHDRLVHVQAGISIGKLNAVLAPYGLTLPVEANPKDTIGSLISNSPKDDYSQKYGGIMNYIDRIEVVLSSGELLQTSRLSRIKLARKQSLTNSEGKIYKKLDELLEKNEKLLEKTDQRLGYPAIGYVKRQNGQVFDILPAFFGAEGSLGVITEVILRLDVISPRPHRLFATFNTYKAAGEFANYCKTLKPITISLYDTRVFKTAEEYGKRPDLLTKKLEDGYIVLVSFNDKSRKSRKKVKKCVKFLPKSANIVIETIQNSIDFDDFQTSLDAFLNDSLKGERPNILNDIYIPEEKLNDFIQDLRSLEQSSKKQLALYGCFSTNNYNIKPELDLADVNERRIALTLLRDTNELINKHGGSLIGGYPEGRLKPIVVYPELDSKSVSFIKNIKEIFDPNNIFAPETKSNYDIRSAVRHLRTEPNQGIVS